MTATDDTLLKWDKFGTETNEKRDKPIKHLNFYDKVKFYENLHEGTISKLLSTHDIFLDSKSNYLKNLNKNFKGSMK